jgi:CHAD domain-containing protein
LLADRDRLLRNAATKKALADAAGMIRRSARDSRRWRSKHRNFSTLAAALRQARHDAQVAMNHAKAKPQAATFHEWRKAVKTLWYELRLLEACGAPVRADLRRLERIQDWLGDDHNVAILGHRLVDHEPLARNAVELQKFQAASENYQRQLRRQALKTGEKIFATPVPQFIARVERGWREWRS